MPIIEITLACALVLSNLFWYLAFRGQASHNLELGKLIASRTLSEYSWLKKVEAGTPDPPKEPGYDAVFDEELDHNG